METVHDKKSDKELYDYQKGAISKIFEKFETAPEDFHLLYQLPTGAIGKNISTREPNFMNPNSLP